MKTKTFDCVRMKREGAERVMKQVEGESLQEQLEYWQKGTEDLKKHQQELRQKGKVSGKTRRRDIGEVGDHP